MRLGACIAAFGCFFAVLSGKHTTLLAQNSFSISDLDGLGVSLTGNEVFYQEAAPLLTTERSFALKNISSSTQTISIRKTEVSIHKISSLDKAEAFFCTGVTCYPSSVYSGSVVIDAGKTVVFKAQLIEAGSKGESVVSYKFMNNASGDWLQFTLRYNGMLIKVNETSVSKLTTRLNVAYAEGQVPTFYAHLPQIDGEPRFRILNSLGEEVYTCELAMGDNLIKVLPETGTFVNGFFYASVQNGTYSLSKKIVITTK